MFCSVRFVFHFLVRVVVLVVATIVIVVDVRHTAF